MEHTWQANHLPKIAPANLDRGDIAVCGSFTSPGSVLRQLVADRVAFVAPLDSRSDLEWLLRGLHLHPNIRHLVLWGDDPRAAGETLIDLWRNGLDDRKRLPGGRGVLSAELDAASVDALRGYVQAWDHRARPLTALATAMADLPPLPREREPRALPDPVIPDRKVFLSRKTTFPIFSSEVGDAWLQLLNLALKIGSPKQLPNGEGLAEALNAVVTVETPAEEPAFPGFLDFNRDDFDRYYRLTWGSPSSNGAPPPHAARLQEWNRIEPLLLAPHEIGASQAAPGLVSATFHALDQTLLGSFVFRSLDLYAGWPFEAMALARLQREAAARLGLEVGASTFLIHATHLYERDWDRALRVLEESFKRPLPLQVDPAGIFLFGNDGGRARAMLLDHDASTIFWEEAFSDPEDLSWYIVDVMPWLLPQHVRYVGQECAALMRAIRAGECYEQG